MKKLSYLLVILVVLSSCDPDKRLISKDLNSRFTKLEIIEIKKDSSNVQEASLLLISLELLTALTNSKIIQGIDKIENKYGSKTPLENFMIIDSLHNRLVAAFKNFENLRFNRKESCYYVKYLVHKNELKIPNEEYFFINASNQDVIHRQCDWDQFVVSKGYNELVKEAAKYSGDIMMLRYKLTGKFD